MSEGKLCSADESSLSSSSQLLFVYRMHLWSTTETSGRQLQSPVTYVQDQCCSLYQDYLKLICTYLSEPVDGVKEQSTEKLLLRFRQALHLLYYIHVGQDQGATCDRAHTHRRFYSHRHDNTPISMGHMQLRPHLAGRQSLQGLPDVVSPHTISTGERMGTDREEIHAWTK